MIFRPLVSRVAKLLASTDITLIPTINPDGFDRGTEGACSGVILTQSYFRKSQTCPFGRTLSQSFRWWLRNRPLQRGLARPEPRLSHVAPGELDQRGSLPRSPAWDKGHDEVDPGAAVGALRQLPRRRRGGFLPLRRLQGRRSTEWDSQDTRPRVLPPPGDDLRDQPRNDDGSVRQPNLSLTTLPRQVCTRWWFEKGITNGADWYNRARTLYIIDIFTHKHAMKTILWIYQRSGTQSSPLPKAWSSSFCHIPPMHRDCGQITWIHLQVPTQWRNARLQLHLHQWHGDHSRAELL